jgi:hypothetical protein
MAISPNTTWEVDAATGSDSNGGGFVAGASGVDKTYGPNQAATTRTDLVVSPIGTPAAPTVSSAGTGGSIPAGTYYVVVTYSGSGGETLASAASITTTTGATSTITVSVPAAAVGASAFKVYVGTASGGPFYLQNGAAGSPISGAAYTLSVAPTLSGTTAPAADTSNVNVASAGAPFAAGDVGNTIQVASGNGWTAGFYQVVAFDAASGKATLDRSPVAGGAANANPGTGTLGGALATFSKAVRQVAASNKLFVKYNAAPYSNFGQFTLASSITPGDGQGGTAPPTRVIGYYQARGDIYQLLNGTWANNANRPTVQASSGTVYVVGTTSGCVVENLVVDGQNSANSAGVWTGTYCTVRNCLVRNCTSYGVVLSTNGAIIDCEVTGCGAAAHAVHSAAGAIVASCHVHDNACLGIYAATGAATIVDNLVVNNTGGSSDGIQVAGNATLLRNTVRGNGRDGISVQAHSNYAYHWRDNVLANNGRYGLNAGLAQGIAAAAAMDGNAYYNNATAARFNADDTTVQPINGVAPYTNRLDVTCSASPFLSDTGTASTSNFALNSSAGGAPCKGAGSPQAWPLAAGTNGVAPTSGAPSLGAAQPAPVAGGGISKGRFLGGD